MWSFAVLLTASAVQVSAGQEQALRLRLGALPALWKLQTDVEALQGYLENPAKAFLQISGPDCECIGKTQGPDCECIGAKPKTSLVSKKGPDCECIGKTQGPDCECIGAKPKTSLVSKKGPDCECINKTQGPDCECIGDRKPQTVSAPAAKKAENATGNATAPVDSETAQLLAKAKSVDVKDMPMMLTILEAMYGRFKDNIKNANELEAKTKKHYEENMAKYKARKAANKDDTALDRMEEYWVKSRKLSHAHYHSMLKVAHAGMARLQMAIDMMSKAVNGQKLDKKEFEHLKAVTPAPTVVLLQVRTDLLQYCKEALAELKIAKSTKTESSTSAPRAPVGFLQIRQDPAPEDALAKEMTHDLEMNFNKIAPFGKEDTAKELQDHAADTQDTLVDAVENAEVAEIKRAVFRALTRLRAATIKEFDTIARLETQAIDAYNDAHHYRAENPLSHLHEDEAPVETDKLKSFH